MNKRIVGFIAQVSCIFTFVLQQEKILRTKTYLMLFFLNNWYRMSNELILFAYCQKLNCNTRFTFFFFFDCTLAMAGSRVKHSFTFLIEIMHLTNLLLKFLSKAHCRDSIFSSIFRDASCQKQGPKAKFSFFLLILHIYRINFAESF